MLAHGRRRGTVPAVDRLVAERRTRDGVRADNGMLDLFEKASGLQVLVLARVTLWARALGAGDLLRAASGVVGMSASAATPSLDSVPVAMPVRWPEQLLDVPGAPPRPQHGGSGGRPARKMKKNSREPAALGLAVREILEDDVRRGEMAPAARARAEASCSHPLLVERLVVWLGRFVAPG